VFLFSQEKMRNFYRQQVKRRVPAHWIEKCQRIYMIHWFGQCQSRSAEYTGFETLPEGVHSHCSVEPSPVSSASVSPQLVPERLRLPSSVPSLSFTLFLKRYQKTPSPPYPRSPSLPPQHRSFFALDHADSRFRRPPPHKNCFPTPPLPSLPDAASSPSPKHFRRPTHIRRPRTTHPNTDRRHPPTATDGPPTCRRHTRPDRRLRRPARAAPSDWGGGDGWGGSSRGGGGQQRWRRQRREPQTEAGAVAAAAVAASVPCRRRQPRYTKAPRKGVPVTPGHPIPGGVGGGGMGRSRQRGGRSAENRQADSAVLRWRHGGEGSTPWRGRAAGAGSCALERAQLAGRRQRQGIGLADLAVADAAGTRNPVQRRSTRGVAVSNRHPK